MKTEVAEMLLAKYGKKNPPVLKAGDTVKIHQKIREGEKERVQIYEGLVIATKHGKGLDGSFTVRKIAAGGIGVERVFPTHSPNIVKVERVKTAEVARAKLYYMRGRKGKSARFKNESANPMVWDEAAAIAALAAEQAAAENDETLLKVEEMIEGVELVEETPVEVEVVAETEVVEVEIPVEEAVAEVEAPIKEAATETEEAPTEVKEEKKAQKEEKAK